jgi:predicted Zn-dependent peptidase
MDNKRQKPPINSQYKLAIPKPRILTLDNGISLYLIKGEGVGIIRMDFMWKGGRTTEIIPGLARSSMQCLNDGTSIHSYQELSELFDFYGSSVSYRSSLEHLHASISLIKANIDDVIPTFISTIFDRKIDSNLLKQRQNRFAERLTSELSKNTVVAYRELTERLFGQDHLYGYSTQPGDYTAIIASQVEKYLNTHINTEGCTVVISGDIGQTEEVSIISLLSSIVRQKSEYETPNYETVKTANDIGERLYLPGHQPNQVTIRMGRRLFSRDHKDADHIRLSNMILGGYFGSRLMTKIREEKGYCYHIDSSVDLLDYDGYISISAEVNSKFTNECLEEIEIEMEQLMKEKVPDDELDRVKQYIRGQFLMDSDGVFAASNLVRRYLAVGKDETEFQKKLEVLETITADDIRSVARKYFNPVEYMKIIVGDIPESMSL